MLWTVLVILITVWLVSFFTSMGGNSIHLLLLLAAALLGVKLLAEQPADRKEDA